MKEPSSGARIESKGVSLELNASLDGHGLKVAIIAAKFNLNITSKLVDGAIRALNDNGVVSNDISIVWVPGSFEIPLIALEVAKTGKWDALVCLGAVIKGETAHFEYVSGEASSGITNASITTSIPMAFGVLTTYTVEQAMARAGGSHGNKGYDAALVAIESANILTELHKS